MLRVQLRRIGNSSGIIIPKAILQLAGMVVGSELDVQLVGSSIVLAPSAKRTASSKKTPR